MAQSHTVVAALKFQGGVLIGADSQVTDDVIGVRWTADKPEQIGNHPLVVAFAGSHGRILGAKESLRACGLRAEQFKSADRVRKVMDAALRPLYEDIQVNSKPPSTHPERGIALLGLAAFWAGGEPHIHEREINGDYCPHDYFHALGSGAKTAYAIYRTLGGPRLCTVDEPKAIMALLRILSTCIQVELVGVSEPIIMYVIRDAKARRLLEDEVTTHLEAVQQWERKEQDRLYAGQI